MKKIYVRLTDQAQKYHRSADLQTPIQPPLLGNFQQENHVLLKKMDVDGVSIQPDMRGRHDHRTTKLLPEAQDTVIDYICSHTAFESHYRRAQTSKRYFDCKVSMRRTWQDSPRSVPRLKQYIQGRLEKWSD